MMSCVSFVLARKKLNYFGLGLSEHVPCKHHPILVTLTGCEGYVLCPLSPEPAIDRAAYPGGVAGAGKQRFQFGCAGPSHTIAAQLIQAHRGLPNNTEMSSSSYSAV